MMKTWAITDTGLVRKENQDTYRISESNRVCVVCDGWAALPVGVLPAIWRRKPIFRSLKRF